MDATDPSTLDQTQRVLPPHLRVQRSLGSGASAIVVQAEDQRHGRRVAVKVMRRELVNTKGAERFLAEIRVASRLTHPHIIPLLDSGIGDGCPYFVMPFVNGETLRARLLRGPAVTVPQALALAIEIADALEYAHAAGIVHRDIKPENVLLLADHAVVADFGLARALSSAAETSAAITNAGIAVGTPAYMSPEQTTGDPALDGRSDVYSLATVLYEMLAGTVPFTAPTTQQLLRKRLLEPPPPLAAWRPDVPPAVAAVVTKALSIAPDDRPAGAGAFARALLETGHASSAASFGLGLGRSTDDAVTTRPVAGPAIPSLAVLPFRTAGTEGADDFLAEGLTEELIVSLNRLRTVRVAARASAFACRDQRHDLRTIASRLGVTTVVDGSVRRAGQRVRVHAELVDVLTGFSLWSDRYDRDMGDALALQDELAQAIAGALSATLLGGVPSGDVVEGRAYEAYLRGRHALQRRTETSLRDAAARFDEAAAAAPGFAAAHAARAEAALLRGIYGMDPPREVLPVARAAAAEARVQDPAMGEAHAIEGVVMALLDWDWPGADAAFRRAFALAPRAPTLWQWHALHVLLPTGRVAEARAAIARARVLDPLSCPIALSVAVVHHLAGDLSAAREALASAEALQPDFPMTAYFLGGVAREEGNHDEAIAAFRRAIALSGGGTPEMLAGLAQALALGGARDGARDLLTRLRSDQGSRTVPPSLLAQVHASLGDLDAATDALLRAADGRDPDLVFLSRRSAYRPLLSLPAVADLRTRMGV